jgi:hypothetical protein
MAASIDGARAVTDGRNLTRLVYGGRCPLRFQSGLDTKNETRGARMNATVAPAARPARRFALAIGGGFALFSVAALAAALLLQGPQDEHHAAPREAAADSSGGR